MDFVRDTLAHGGALRAFTLVDDTTRECLVIEVDRHLPARVFLSVGAEEGKTMVPPMRQFGELLAKRGYQGLTLDTVVFQGESHTSVVPAMVSRTMRVLYAKTK